MLPVLQVPNDFTLLPLLLLPLAVNLSRYERPQSVPHAVQAAAAAAVDNGDDDTCNTHAISDTATALRPRPGYIRPSVQ